MINAPIWPWERPDPRFDHAAKIELDDDTGVPGRLGGRLCKP
jgi:hypothetical protein